MSHNLEEAMPGRPGRPNSEMTGRVGHYLCSCGEVTPGIGSFRKHRATALRAEAVERVANALAQEILGSSIIEFLPDVQTRYHHLANIALDAAKPVREKGARRRP